MKNKYLLDNEGADETLIVPEEVLIATKRFLKNHSLERILEELKSHELSLVPLLGPPGSGKDTIINSLKKKYPEIICFGSGEFFRNGTKFHLEKEAIKDLTTIANFYLCEKGLLLPKKITVTAFAYELLYLLRNKLLSSKSLLFTNGWPRTIEQVNTLLNFVRFEFIMALSIDKETSKERILARSLYSERKDDLQFETRFKTYLLLTKPVFDYFRTLGIEVKTIESSKLTKEKSYLDFEKVILSKITL